MTPRSADDADFFKTVFSRVEPLATSRLVIGNDFVPDLPPELWDGDDITRQITRAGERLDALDLLPAAFPIEEILSDARPPPREAALRHRRPELRQRERAPARRPGRVASRSTG